MSTRTLEEKIAIWNYSPFCYWCGKETFMYRDLEKGIGLPDDAATIDHVYASTDPRRKEFRKQKKPSPVVLSCYKCNYERNTRLLEKQEKICGKNTRDFITSKKLYQLVNDMRSK